MATKIGFTLDEAEVLRKIVGKKKTEEMPEWQEKIKNKIKEKKLPKEIGEIFWKICEDSAAYSFNRCLSLDTVVDTRNGHKMLYEVKNGDEILAYDIDNNINHYVKIINKYLSKSELYEVELNDKRKIKCSMKHKFLCSDKKMYTLEEIIVQNLEICVMLL